MMQAFKKLSNTLFHICTLLSISLRVSAISPSSGPSPYILLANQSLNIPLLSYVSQQGVSFNLVNPPQNASLNNPLQSNSSITLNNVPQNVTAANINATYIAMIDQNLNLYYGSLQTSVSNIPLGSIVIPATPNSVCSSVVFAQEYVAISCGVLNTSSNTQTQTLYLFNTNTSSFNNISQQLPFTGLQSVVQGSIAVSSVLPDPIIAASFNNVTSQSSGFLFCLFQVSNLSSSCFSFPLTIPSVTDINFQSIQANGLQVKFFDVSGGVYFSSIIAEVPQLLSTPNLITTIQDTIIGSCSFPFDYANFPVIAFSSTTFYYLSGYTLMYTYSIPNDFSAVSCALDARFLYVVAKNSQDNSYQTFVYVLDNVNNQYFLIQTPTGLSNVLAMSAGATTQVNVLSSDSIWILSASLPSIQLQNVQASSSFNVTVNNSNQTLSFNVTVISQSEQIYQIGNGITPISSISTPIINLQNLFVGPSLGAIFANNVYFGGVYGTCTISNFGILNLTSFDNLVLKLSPTQTSSLNTNIVSGTIVFTSGPSIGYINILINNLYSAGSWASQQTCNSTIQVAQTATIYNFSATPTQCLFGQEYELCQVNNQAYHVGESQNIIPLTYYQCQQVYFWEGSSYMDQVTVCITSNNISVFSQKGTPLASFTAAQIGLDSFSPVFVSTNPSFPELLVVSYPQGLIGIQVSLVPQNTIVSLPLAVVFKKEISFSQSSYLQLTSNRLVLADFVANTIVEWDISDIYNPFMIGNYELFAFTLDSNLQPIYNPIPNHLIFKATNNGAPYLLTFQPGNMATSVLLYATDLQGFYTNPTSVNGAQSSIITSTYDPINQFSLLLIANQNSINYFYASASSYITLPNVTLGQTNCLYCPGNTQIQISSNVITNTPFDINIPYILISTEQTISSLTPPQLSIQSNAPICNVPYNLFEGTILDYSLENLTVGQISATYIQTPLNASLNLSLSIVIDSFIPQGLIQLFSDGTNLYVMFEKGLSFINLQQTPYEFQDILLNLTFEQETIFVSADAQGPQSPIALAYITGGQWGVLLYPSISFVSLPVPIMKIRVVGNIIFALSQGNFNLLYALNGANQQLSLVSTIKLGIPNLIPIDFVANNLFQDIYGILLIDGSDTLYCVSVNITSGAAQPTIFSGFTQTVQNDLPPVPLEIVALQSSNVESGQQIATINYLLSVKNFHTYQTQIIYTGVNQANLGNILNCFMQMPGHISQGNVFLTDYYFLDVKLNGNQYYVYSYPLNLTYSSTYGQAGNYSYIKPIQRQPISGTSNISMYGVNGETGTLFVAISTLQLDISDQEVDMLVYNLTSFFEIGLNPTLTSSALSSIGGSQVNLTLGNDISSVSFQIALGSHNSILDSAYFIAFTCVFTVLFCGACAWFFRRAYKKRQSRLLAQESLQQSAEQGLVV